MYRLDEASGVRVGAGGLFYGPVRLVGRATATALYLPRDAAWLKRRLCIEPLPRAGGLQAVANALNKGDMGLAQIATLHLELEPFSPAMLTRLAKANFDPSEPRDDHGRWTSGQADENTGSASSNQGTSEREVTLAAARGEDVATMKQRFVDAHLLC